MYSGPDTPHRLTAPRCGTHGGVRVAGRTFDYGPARRMSVPPTVPARQSPSYVGGRTPFNLIFAGGRVRKHNLRDVIVQFGPGLIIERRHTHFPVPGGAMDTQYETVIGLEVHVQLRTQSKMFCSCGADYQLTPPNTRVCPVCMALPGTLPVVNSRAVEDAIKIGLALNCKVAETTKFDRKNYAYPDLMKGYQISQYDVPICYDGYMDLPGEPPSRIGIERVHMEEDVARLLHIPGSDGEAGHTLMDVNRAGVPLMEVVSRPDLRTTEQVEAYISNLQMIIRYLNVGTANMEEGSFRCDANVSVRPAGSKELGAKVEIKNMNRIRAVTRALEHEIARQTRVVRGWRPRGAGNPRMGRRNRGYRAAKVQRGRARLPLFPGTRSPAAANRCGDGGRDSVRTA